MGDQIYYKVQYPLKKAIDLMKDIEEKNFNLTKTKIKEDDREKIIEFINSWNNSDRDKLKILINNLKNQK